MWRTCRKSIFCLGLSVALLAGILTSSALALVKMDSESVELAIKYGMQNRRLGYMALLGPNWIEGENGALLNIYTPFMMLAQRASKLSTAVDNPQPEDIKDARKRLYKFVKFYLDPLSKPEVKFAVSFFGDTPEVGKRYSSARIEGFGRGRALTLKPSKQILDPAADPAGTPSKPAFMAVNSYYFPLSELVTLNDFQLILEDKETGSTLSFNVKADKIY
jgi:hypothetical protein